MRCQRQVEPEWRPRDPLVPFIPGTTDTLEQMIPCCGHCPVRYRMASSIPGRYPLEASRSPLWLQPKMCPGMAKCLLRAQMVENVSL